jgi:hypothetical protein
MAIEKHEVRNRWTGNVQFTAEIEVTPDMTQPKKLGLAVRWGCQNGAYLRGAYLSGANLRSANLSGANLSDADLRGANLRSANLSGADLSGANLSDADLRGADLSSANLSDADLRGADLSGANLSDADLRGADLSGANLSDANLRDADLSGVYLRSANLSSANLSDADLRGAYLSGADLRSFKADLWMILAMAQGEVPALVKALREGRVDGSTYAGKCACLVGTLENAGATSLPHDASSPAEQWFAMISKGDKPGEDTAGGFAASKALEWVLEYCDLHGRNTEA